MSRWYFFVRGNYEDSRENVDYHIYFAVQPFLPLDHHDPQFKGIRAWVRVTILDVFHKGGWLFRMPHVDIASDLDTLLRAPLEDLGSNRSLYFGGGKFREAAGKGPYRGPLRYPKELRHQLREAEKYHPVHKPKREGARQWAAGMMGTEGKAAYLKGGVVMTSLPL